MGRSPKNATRLLAYAVRGLTALLLLALSIGIAFVLFANKKGAAQDTTRDDVRRVDAMEAAYAEVHRSWEGFGTAAAMDSANVTAEITGLIVEVPEAMREGRSVTRGDTLAVIDAADYEDVASEARLAIENLQAQLGALVVEEQRLAEQVDLAAQELEFARLELDRLQEALAADAVKPVELDRKQREVRGQERIVSQLRQQLELVEPRRQQLNAQIASQRERLAVAQRDVQRSIVRSPIDGVLQTFEVEEGERVSPGAPIARVVSLTRVEVPLQFPISARGAVAPGSPVLMQSRGARTETWQAPIARILPESDPNSRTFIAYIEFDGAAAATATPTPGQFIRGTVQAQIPDRRLIVPRRALLNRMAYVAERRPSPVEPGGAEMIANGEAKEVWQVARRPVDIEYYIQGGFDRLSPEDSEWAVLAPSSELSAGEIVVLSNLDDLKPGMRVTPVLVTERLAGGATP